MSDKAYRDNLSSLNTIFRLKKVKIFASESVTQIDNSKIKTQCTLIISTPGIFLLSKKSFRKPVYIIDSIPYIDLTAVHISNQNVSFVSSSSTIRVSHESANDLGCLAYFIRQVLFPMSLSPISLNLEVNEQFKFDPASFPYKARDVFSDRYLSCIMKYNIEVTSEIKYPHLEENGVFIFTKEIIEGPLIQPLILALAFEEQVRVLNIQYVSLSNLIPLCSPLFCVNKFIKSVIFFNTDFKGAGPVLEKSLSSPHLFKPTEIIFKYCEFAEGLNFFQSFNKIGWEISSLQFVRCIINKKSMNTLFDIIVSDTSICFHSIENIMFTEVRKKCGLSKAVSQLCQSEWANLAQSLHRISLRNCDVEISKIINNFLSSDTGVERLVFNQCRFLQKMKDSVVQIHKLKELNLEGCHFTSETLLSLFSFLSRELVSVSRLNLSFLKIDENEFNVFLDHLSEFTIPSLKLLEFDANTMDSDQLLKFNDFLIKQKSLTALFLNGSISVQNGHKGVKKLLKIIDILGIDRIGIRGAGTANYNFGSFLTRFFQKMCQKGTIRSLDITNQQLTKEGIDALTQLIKQTPLQELYYDGIIFSNFEVLFSLSDEIIKSDLLFSVWPLKECERLLSSLVDESLIEKTKNIINYFQSKFISKYGTKPPKIDLKRPKNGKNLEEKENIQFEYFNSKEIAKRDPEIDQLYKECIDTEKYSYTDPVLSLLSLFENSISIEELQKSLK